jgi:hypothetical protein
MNVVPDLEIGMSLDCWTESGMSRLPRTIMSQGRGDLHTIRDPASCQALLADDIALEMCDSSHQTTIEVRILLAAQDTYRLCT